MILVIFKKSVLDFKDTAVCLRVHFYIVMHQQEGTKDEIRQVATSHYCNSFFSFFFGGGGRGMFFVPLQEQFAGNTNKSYHVYKVIVELHIYHKRRACIKPVFCPPPLGSQKSKVTLQHYLWIRLLDKGSKCF